MDKSIFITCSNLVVMGYICHQLASVSINSQKLCILEHVCAVRVILTTLPIECRLLSKLCQRFNLGSRQVWKNFTIWSSAALVCVTEQTCLKELLALVVPGTCFFFLCVCDRADTFEGVDLFVLDTCFCDRADKFKGVARVGRPRHLFVCHVCHTHVM